MTDRAKGGPVLPGSTYIVGESGPETLLMGGGGWVVPMGYAGERTFTITMHRPSRWQRFITRLRR